MYISCGSLWNAGITMDKVGCCGSCHDDADEYPGDYPLLEIYTEDIGLPRSDRTVGAICCAVSHFLDELDNKEALLRSVYDRQS